MYKIILLQEGKTPLHYAAAAVATAIATARHYNISLVEILIISRKPGDITDKVS